MDFSKILNKEITSVFDIEKKNPSHTALCSDQGISVSYGELECQIVHMRKLYPSRCLIFCMCQNEPGAVIGYLGAIENRVVPLLLDANLEKDQLEQFLERYKPAYIWASLEWAEIHAKYLKTRVYEVCGYGLWETGYEICLLYPELALLLATSGSTGDPKLVRISYANLRANTMSICEYLQLDESERPITTLPMQYTYGLSIINSHLMAGACILMTTVSYVQSGFWKFLEKERATSFGGVPYTYEILKKIHLFQKKIPSLRSITQAGGKLSVPLQREIARWAGEQSIKFYVMYGQTEATARMAYLPPERCMDKPGSIGIAIPGGAFILLDESGKEITAKDKIGELVYMGENVSLGYALRQTDLRMGDERKGVLHTGDMAKRDADGYYYIAGRKKRFVKIYGVRVSLDACEQILREKYPDLEAACSGRDDQMKVYIAWKMKEPLQKDKAVLIKDESTARKGRAEQADIQSVSEKKSDQSEGMSKGCSEAYRGKELAEYVANDLASCLHLNKSGFEGIWVDQIPKNSAGKILYAKL